MFVSQGITETLLKLSEVVQTRGRYIARGDDRRANLNGLWLDYKVLTDPKSGCEHACCLRLSRCERPCCRRYALVAEGWQARWGPPQVSRNVCRHIVNCSGDTAKMLRDLTFVKLADVF